MIKRETVALGVSIAAFVVSLLSFSTSWDGQRHNRIVSFEQRRQEVRQTLLEGQLLLAQSDEIVRAAIRDANDTVSRDKHADVLHDLAVLRGELEAFLKEFDQIPASPDTKARLALERVGPRLAYNNQKLRVILEKARPDRPIPKSPS